MKEYRIRLYGNRGFISEFVVNADNHYISDSGKYIRFLDDRRQTIQQIHFGDFITNIKWENIDIEDDIEDIEME